MLCAGYAPELLARIEQRITAKRYDLRSLAGVGEAEIIGEDELRKIFAGEPLMNVNTCEDLQEAIRHEQ
jgi:molybdopterin-guanine dinucleotide biosynthesis protein A